MADVQKSPGIFLYVQKTTGIFLYVQKNTGSFLYVRHFARSNLFASTFCIRTQVLLGEISSKLICFFLTLLWTYLQSFVNLWRKTTPQFTLKDRRRYRKSAMLKRTKNYWDISVRTEKSREISVRTIKSLYVSDVQKNPCTPAKMTKMAQVTCVNSSYAL